MNFAPYLRLVWKEYRAIRLFWLCLVVLVIFIQWLMAVTIHVQGVVPQFHLALMAPALFALGCAGTAFAIEKEDGTFEFLRAIPISSQQLFISKLLLTVLASVAMYLVLWLAAMWITGHATPALDRMFPDAQSELLRNMLGLWLVAALEAIVWGTLFSLITARPLLSICLAVTIGSTITHLLASHGQRQFGFELAAYARAIPLRVLVALIVGAIDVYLGLNWLHGRHRQKRATGQVSAIAAAPLTASSPCDIAHVHVVLATPERPTMLAHLTWQHLRQSGWLMILLTSLSIAAVIGIPESVGILLTPVLAVLMGAFVFRADQEGHHFRFFVEHNVPPRLVWISRQIPWLFALLVSTLIGFIWSMGYSKFALPRLHGLDDRSRLELLNAAMFILTSIGLAYAAGQWTSMFLRSGLLAGFTGVLLTAVLCSWASLMTLLHISWTWSVAPIPLVLLCATWLRAPDWIRENTTCALASKLPQPSLFRQQLS